MIWFIRSIWSVWFNQTNETDQINKRDQPVLALHRYCLWGLANGGLDGTKIPVGYPMETDLIQQCGTLSP